MTPLKLKRMSEVKRLERNLERKDKPMKKKKMNLREHVKEIEEKYQAGQNLFRRESVGFLLERISQLEQSAQQGVKRTVAQPCEKHGMEFCVECYPTVKVDFNRR